MENAIRNCRMQTLFAVCSCFPCSHTTLSLQTMAIWLEEGVVTAGGLVAVRARLFGAINQKGKTRTGLKQGFFG